MFSARMKIAQRLSLGFGAVLLLTVIMGGVAIRTMTAMSELTSDLYTHPFTVTNALLQVRSGVNAMRADVITLVNSNDQADVERLVAQVVVTEADIAQNVAIIAKQYLGSPDDVRALAQSLAQWKVIRDQTIALGREGQFAAALANSRAHGRPQYFQLRTDLDRIYAFASHKAVELQQKVEVERGAATLHILASLAVMLVVGIILARIITNSIVGPLTQLRQCMARLSDGELTVEVPYRQGDSEVAHMARAVAVFKDAAVHLDQQRWIKDGIARLSIAVQAAESQAEFGRVTFEILAPLLDLGHGVFFVETECEGRQAIAAWGQGPAPETGDCLTLPLTRRGSQLAVIEMSAVTVFSDMARVLLDEVAPVLALNLDVLNRNLWTRKLLAQTQAQAAALQVSQAELERFAEVLAHHIQEPVRLQHSFAEMLRKSFPPDAPEESRTALGYIVGGAVRLRALIRDAQLYLGLKQLPPPAQPCRADAAFDAARHAVMAEVTDKDVIIDVQALPSVWISSARLADVFRLLLDNSVQYKRPDCPLHITVAAQRQGQMQVLSVTDNGTGIAPEYRERVFRVFERLHSNREAAGTGIGLALVRKIVELAHGTVWIESGEDGGIRVCLSLFAGDTDNTLPAPNVLMALKD